MQHYAETNLLEQIVPDLRQRDIVSDYISDFFRHSNVTVINIEIVSHLRFI